MEFALKDEYGRCCVGIFQSVTKRQYEPFIQTVTRSEEIFRSQEKGVYYKYNTYQCVPRGENRYSFESVFYLHSHFWYKLYYPGPPPPLCLYVFMCNLIQFVTIHKPLFYDIVEIPISLLDDCHIILWNILKYYDFLLGSIII